MKKQTTLLFSMLALFVSVNHTYSFNEAIIGDSKTVFFVDADGDGYDAGVDCDDNNDKVYPFAPELTDGLDNNCDGNIDEISINPLILDLGANVSISAGDTILGIFPINGFLYLAKYSDADGLQILISNGVTVISTISLGAIPGVGTEDVQRFFAINNNELFFPFYTNANGIELWKTNGTLAGTQMVKDINPGSNSSEPFDIIAYNGNVYFSAIDSSDDSELWKTDGTAAGTVRVKDIVPGLNASNPNQKIVHNGLLYFTTNPSGGGKVLWKSDGTELGTVMVTAVTSPKEFISYNGFLYFGDLTPSPTPYFSIWRTDGTTTTNIVPTPHEFLDPVVLGNNLYFASSGGSGDEELWMIDGLLPVPLPILLKDINSGGPSLPRQMIVYNNMIYFQANDGIHGNELWQSDGTALGTVLLADIYGNSDGGILNSANPSFFTEIDGALYFLAQGPNIGNVWVLKDQSTPDFVWTGNTNTDWTVATNWQSNNAPGLSTNKYVQIPTGRPNYPVLASGQNLVLEFGSSLVVENGASLTVSPNVTVSNFGSIASVGTITFQSDNTGSAYIAPSFGRFYGDYTIERYIPAKRAFRFLSTPVTTSDFIANNWQQGTHITGSATGANGFDATITGNPSMFTFDNFAQTFNEIPNTDATNLTAGTPYRLIVRGDRTIDLFQPDNNPTPTPTTLVSKGKLEAENTIFKAVPLNETAGMFNFVGNPFQSQLDMRILLPASININPFFYWAWDPNLGIRGAYTIINVLDGSATAGDANQFLQAGQACFVKTRTNGTTSVIFNQLAKITAQNQPETNVFKGGSKSNVNTGRLGLKLYESNAFAASLPEADGITINFDDTGNNGIDDYDAEKFTNLDENFASKNNGILLSYETRATPTIDDEIQLVANAYRNSNYVIAVTATALQGDTPFLLDSFTDILTEIPKNGVITYTYSVDSKNADSIDEERFKIIFQKTLSVESNDLDQITLYPNPTNTGSFNLVIPQRIDNLEMTIYNTLGAKLFYKNDFTENKVSINTNFARTKGVYFVKLTSSDGETITKKLIIK